MKFIYKNKKTGMYLLNDEDDTLNINKCELYDEHTGVLFIDDKTGVILPNEDYERIEFDKELKINRKEKLLKIYEKQ